MGWAAALNDKGTRTVVTASTAVHARSQKNQAAEALREPVQWRGEAASAIGAPPSCAGDDSRADLRCAHCGALGAPAVCGGCHRVRYCGLECQRLSWRDGHRTTCAR